MTKFRTVLVAIFLLGSAESWACTFFVPTPKEQLEKSAAVVLAVPKAISFVPKESEKRDFAGRFRQTVLWEVLISWKGHYKAGETFTTRRSFSNDLLCGSQDPVYFKEVRVLYLEGREPYAKFGSWDPSFAADDFKYLQATKVVSGAGT